MLDVPPAAAEVVLFGSAIDSWEVPLVDVGPAGEDAGRGGRYLFLPPEHPGAAPDGYLVVPSPTCYVHVALRPITPAQGTLDDAVAYSQRLRPTRWRRRPIHRRPVRRRLSPGLEDAADV